jgi:regulator of protease activity HflC (stomatin/prohibitin superfamily)
VADRNGNPLVLSAIVTYYIEDSRRAALDVQNYDVFIKTQATCVLKIIAAQYPYESTDHSPSLKNEAGMVKEHMRKTLQAKIAVTGARIDSFELTDLSYAPEV